MLLLATGFIVCQRLSRTPKPSILQVQSYLARKARQLSVSLRRLASTKAHRDQLTLKNTKKTSLRSIN